MREHMGLYRGKRIDNGEWVEGSLVISRYETPTKSFDSYRIEQTTYGRDDDGFATYMSGYDEEVDPETVGECTGLRDKNGKLIFEGDLCLCDRNINDRLDRKVYEIKCEPTRGFFGENFCEISADEFCVAEVVGIVHDNPELLEVRND